MPGMRRPCAGSRSTCFELGPKVQLAEKEAQLAFLTRERFGRTEVLRTR